MISSATTKVSSSIIEKPRRIALFLPHLEGGGAERVMVQLAAEFVKLGFKVDLVLVNATGSYKSLVPPEVRLVDLNAKNTYTSLPGLIYYLRNEKPDVLLSTLDLSNLIALISKRISRVSTRIVVRIASTVSIQRRSRTKKKFEKILLSRIYPWADKIIAPSDGAKIDLVEYTGIKPELVQRVYNPVITPELLEASMQPVDHPWFENTNIPVILGVGRLTEAKDFPTLLQAFALVRRSVPARLVILGEGEEQTNLEEITQKLNIVHEVDLPGFVKDPFAFMSKASVFVLSSKWEGLPGVLIQALACGCPVVSTDCPSGPSEILNQGKYGHLVPVGDSEALTNAILHVLAGNGQRPPTSWLEQFKVDVVIRQYLVAMGILARKSLS